MPGVPNIVLPNFTAMTVSPVAGLAEIRNSLAKTQANIEAALPAGGPTLPTPPAGATSLLNPPDLLSIFKGPGTLLTPTPTPSPSAPATPAAAPAPARITQYRGM